jgi:hypothetical protein
LITLMNKSISGASVSVQPYHGECRLPNTKRVRDMVFNAIFQLYRGG